MQNKHDPAKQLKKEGTTGQESTVFILLEENEQSEPIRTLPLNQEVVKRKNQRARGHSTLLLKSCSNTQATVMVDTKTAT